MVLRQGVLSFAATTSQGSAKALATRRPVSFPRLTMVEQGDPRSACVGTQCIHSRMISTADNLERGRRARCRLMGKHHLSLGPHADIAAMRGLSKSWRSKNGRLNPKSKGSRAQKVLGTSCPGPGPEMRGRPEFEVRRSCSNFMSDLRPRKSIPPGRTQQRGTGLHSLLAL